MQHLAQLEKSRLKKLYNLAPIEISEKEAQPFIMKVPIVLRDFHSPKNINALPGHQIKLRANSSMPAKNEKINQNAKTFIGESIKSPVSLLSRFNSKIPYSRMGSTVFGRSYNDSVGPKTLDQFYSKKEKTALASLTQQLAAIKKPQPIDFEPNSLKNIGFYDMGCLTCGKENIHVTFHGDRHICINCRRSIKTNRNDRALIYLDREGNVKCQGLRVIKQNGKDKKIIYDISNDDLILYNIKCYATLSGKDELIVLLQDDQKALTKESFEKVKRLNKLILTQVQNNTANRVDTNYSNS